ncbi:MAG TPA: DUF1795 domain-containing protein [Dehalococcoidia bacterium]|nr:DUF1795 domain-containing protein [Dehalococcoidia bacterium]
MKRRKWHPIPIVGLVLLLASSIVACGPPEEAVAPPPPIEETKTYTNSQYGFSFDCPKDWDELPQEMFEQEEGAAFVVAAGFWAPVACGGGFANVNVVRETLPSRVSVQAYWEENKQRVREELERYTIISERGTEINGVPAVKVVATFDYQVMPVQHVQAFLVEGKTGWVVTCTCTPDCWDEYEPTFSRIVDSFRFVD